MRLWRITQPSLAQDRSCAIAARYGGRWNPVGMPALYASNSIALSALEKFVHIGATTQPELALVAIDVPDDCALLKPHTSDLPTGWAELPVSPAARQFGAAWLSSASELGLWVPSVLIPEEFNLLINPRHSDFSRVVLSAIRSFSFDWRMFK